MEDAINNYIDELANWLLSSPTFSSIPNDQREPTLDKIKDHLYNVAMDSLIDNLSEEQINQIKDLDFDSPQMSEKIQAFSASIPNFALTLNDKLKEEALRVSQTGQIPS